MRLLASIISTTSVGAECRKGSRIWLLANPEPCTSCIRDSLIRLNTFGPKYLCRRVPFKARSKFQQHFVTRAKQIRKIQSTTHEQDWKSFIVPTRESAGGPRSCTRIQNHFFKPRSEDFRKARFGQTHSSGRQH